jgi:hypothetical protein
LYSIDNSLIEKKCLRNNFGDTLTLFNIWIYNTGVLTVNIEFCGEA